MRIVRFAVYRPIATAVCFLATLLLGLYSLFQLSVDFLPDIDIPRFIVRTDAPSLNAGDVEEYVTRPIEAALSAISGVRRLKSISQDGISFVEVEFNWGSDMDLNFIKARSSLDQGHLPQTADRPTILRFDPSAAPIMTLVVTSDRVEQPRSTRDHRAALMELREVAQAVIKRRLEQTNGVAYVQVAGGLDREIQIHLDAKKSLRYNIGFAEVEASLKQFNITHLGGSIRDGFSQFPLRIQAEFTNIQQIRQIPVQRTPKLIHLQDVARVEEGYAERTGYTRLNGHEVITLYVFKESGANTVEASAQVYDSLYRFSQEYANFDVVPVFGQAEFISESIHNVLQSLYLGGLFAFFILIYFLRDLKNPLIVGLSIPISIIITFICMYFLDIHFNIVSLGGLALGIGILVDNSIVVLENIYRYREMSYEPGEAAVHGTREVGLAITASTLTTMSVFMPLVYVKGIAGALFYEQAVTISLALAASLIVSIMLLPMLSARSWSAPNKSGQLYCIGRVAATPFLRTIDLFQYLFNKFFLLYEYILVRALRHRWKVAGALFTLLALSTYLGTSLGRELIPTVDRKHLVLRAELPSGTNLPTTAAEITSLERRLLREDGVVSVLSSIGITHEILDRQYRPGLNKAVLDIEIAEGSESANVAERIEAAFGEFSHLTLSLSPPESTFEQLFQQHQTQFDLKIIGPQLTILADLSQRITDFMQQDEDFTNARANLQASKQVFNVEVQREAALQYGILPAELADFINRQLQGSTPTQFVDFANRIDIKVRAEHSDELDLWRVLNMQYPVKTQGRLVSVPLSELVRLKPGAGYEAIHRENQVRTVAITAALQGLDFAQAKARLDEFLPQLAIPDGYWIEIGTQHAELQEHYQNLYLILFISIVLVYFILAAQFESLAVPFVIVVAVPLASIGVVCTLWLTGNTLNIMSLLGCIVLVGIVVNDSIVKTDFIHRHYRASGDLGQAIVEAGQKRFRPICMTTLTTICGLLPMALSSGSGSELRRPLAWAVIGGISLSTLLILIAVPILYSVVTRAKD